MIVTALLLAAVQTTAAPAAPPAATTAPVTPATATAPAARLNLDTPVETIMADPKGKAVMDANIPGLDAHPSYEMAKGMSLNQIKGYAPEQFTDARLTKISTELAAVK